MNRQPASRLRVDVSGRAGTVASRRALGRWLERVAPATARGELSVALVSDARIQDLNRRFRGVDEPTDVLSFAVADEGQSPGKEGPLLGDIVIATGVSRRQARAAAHPLTVEWRVLALHGLLHLLGYDHDHERDNGRMARVERRLRRRARLREGLIERGTSL